MAFRVVRAGASAALQVDLRRGDSVKAEPDALVTMSQHVTLGAALDAGLLGACHAVELEARTAPGMLILGCEVPAHAGLVLLLLGLGAALGVVHYAIVYGLDVDWRTEVG